MANWFRQSLRLLGHELKRGELTIIFISIVLAVTTVFALSGFSSVIHKAIVNESTAYIAADRVLQSAHPVDEKFSAKAQELELQQAQQLLFRTMAFAGDEMLLSSIKAVSEGYPLRGELLVQRQADQTEVLVNAPAKGEVWVEPKILSYLNVALGDKIEIGAAEFVVAGVIKKIPDASFSLFTQGPAVILHIDDVPKTEVIQPGSRLTYRYLFAGAESNINEYESWVEDNVEDNQRWYDIQRRQSPIADSLNRAQKFLSLASMLGIVLAAVAVAVASMRYSQRHQPMVAVFKAIGASKKYIVNLYIVHWGLLSLAGIATGLVLGSVLLFVGLNYIRDFVPEVAGLMSISAIGTYPFLVALVTGLICSVAFSLNPLKQLLATSPLAVIRGFKLEMGSVGWRHGVPVFALLLLMYIFSQDIVLSLALFVGGLLISGVLLVLGYSMVSLGRGVKSGAGQAFHLAMANLKRRAKENSIQLISFTLAIQLLLMIIVIRTDLLNEWQAQLPVDAPNRFLVNINKDQVKQIDDYLAENNISASGLYPVVRGRLTAINDDKVTKPTTKEDTDETERGRQGVGRELNLTWRGELPDNNEIVEGEWWAPNSEVAEVSVESEIAMRLDLKLGDTLWFQLGGQEVEVKITSIRSVDWQTMQPNFFMIFNPVVLQDFPATYITSIHIKPEQSDAFDRFIYEFMTVSMIDVDAMINQLRSVIDQVSIAIEFILVLVVIAAALVLVAQVQASMEERERELAILRTLGAKGSLLRNAVLGEFVLLGTIAGILASVAMEVSVYVLQSRVFEMDHVWHLDYWLLGVAVGALFVGVLGYLSCARLLRMTSVTLIRRTL